MSFIVKKKYDFMKLVRFFYQIVSINLCFFIYTFLVLHFLMNIIIDVRCFKMTKVKVKKVF